MFGSRGRGSAIIDALRRAREAEVQSKNKQKSLQSYNDKNETLTTASSTESLVYQTSRMELENSLRDRRGSVETSGNSSEESSLESKSSSRFTSQSTSSKNEISIEGSLEQLKGDEASWYGTSGKKIDLLSNCIELQVSDERRHKGFHEHRVRFEPELDSKALRCKILNGRKDVFGPAVIFDGFRLYLPFCYNGDPIHSKSQKYKIHISYTRVYDYKDHQAVHIYNLLMKQICGALRMVQMKKDSFLPSKALRLEKHRLEVWPGYVVSVNNYGSSGLLLQCNMKSKVLRTQTVHDIIHDIISSSANSSNNEDIQRKIKRSLIGECILTKYNNKTYRIDDIDFELNPCSTFQMNGKEESFENYYSQQYQINVKDLKQPLLIHNPRIPRIINDQSKNVYSPISLIPELCYMTGLNDPMRNDFALMKDLATLTKLSPQQRKITIEKLLKEIKSNEEAHKILQLWGLSLADKALPLEGRVLQPSIVRFGNGYRIEASGDFSRDTLNNPVVGPVNISNWLLVFDQRNQEYSKHFVSMLTNNIARNLGIQICNPKFVALRGGRTEEFAKTIRQNLSADSSIQLIVTIIDSPKSDLYSAVKKICCVENSVASQFILKKNLNPAKKSQAIIGKIALQINCKLGGELWAGQSPYKNAMIVGIDVYHDPSGHHRSCLGFVASLNKSYSQWYSTTERNTNREEICYSLGKCMKRAMQAYIEKNGEAPSRVVVYRDGVGDSRLYMIQEYEAPQLLKVCESFNNDQDTPIKLTIIVVSKKVNTRVIEINGNSVANPPPGTIVDHSITENRKYPNFYLVSQKIGEGTVTPIHYIMAYDNSNMTAEHAQKLSYRLTYMYYNWPGAIRVPVPCQYAHKLAALVGEYIGRETNPALSDKLFFL